MIRTLAITAAVSFAIAVGCFVSAFAVAGGPFFIDHHLRFHSHAWREDVSISQAGPGVIRVQFEPGRVLLVPLKS